MKEVNLHQWVMAMQSSALQTHISGAKSMVTVLARSCLRASCSFLQLRAEIVRCGPRGASSYVAKDSVGLLHTSRNLQVAPAVLAAQLASPLHKK